MAQADQKMRVQYLRERIVSLANQGVDIREIAHRYQISIDQVALILRIAKNQQEKRE